MSKQANCFWGVLLLLAFAVISQLIPSPKYSSLHLIQGVVGDTYNKTVSSGKATTRYKVIEIKVGSSVQKVRVERFRPHKKIKRNDNISVKVDFGGIRPDILHVWELVLNENPVITYQDFVHHHRRTHRTIMYFSLGMAVACFFSGLYYRHKGL